MNPGGQDPLAALHPLRQPADIGWWPPAPGWWGLAIILLLVLITLGWCLWRRHQARRYRRAALARLDALHRDEPGADFAGHCNRLLKAVALRSFSRRDVAALTGRAWLDFLNSGVPGRGAPLFAPTFIDALYRDDLALDSAERTRLFHAARQWIVCHRSGA